MRFLVRAEIPTEAGNLMMQDPNLLGKLEAYINKVKAEATYFYESDGKRITPPSSLIYRARIRYQLWLNRCLVEWVHMWSSIQ